MAGTVVLARRNMESEQAERSTVPVTGFHLVPTPPKPLDFVSLVRAPSTAHFYFALSLPLFICSLYRISNFHMDSADLSRMSKYESIVFPNQKPFA